MSEEFKAWIGRSDRREDVATPRLIGEYRATLAPYLFEPPEPHICPPGLHWGLAPALPAMEQLGPDGAEAKGLFLPPIPHTRRMWAGGQIACHRPIGAGMAITRTSTIAGVKTRGGKAGHLCFVSIVHEIAAGATLLMRERQDLVYREAGALPPPPPAPQSASGELEWTVEASPVLLFRFSAFTFNAHRIHYDLPHATQTEGHDGLLVHGPLQAALLLNQAATVLGAVPALFDYRCTAPLVAGPDFKVLTAAGEGGTTGRIVDRSGIVTCEGRATA
jgi:3-methylfumaryl-CoA hydratase